MEAIAVMLAHEAARRWIQPVIGVVRQIRRERVTGFRCAIQDGESRSGTDAAGKPYSCEQDNSNDRRELQR
ncbi:hypothetical protein [Agromyces albus]|uniref:hypothetical protein n=1 Tax=Agromyces albus TaxID=205332 RepID=UPI0027854E8C|nr:hypothetical protein [Agromyces albus]MDQ0574034.1 hypothetical protein [Agromyces albus]